MGKHNCKITKLGKKLGANVIPVNSMNSVFEAVIRKVQNSCLSTM